MRQRQLLHNRVPSDVWRWLIDPASLTQRLRRACGGSFRVRVVEHGYLGPEQCELDLLSLRPGNRALIREVQLLCDDEPWVFARSVIPVATLSGPQRRLAHLGNRPLGAVLFSDRSMQRSEVEIAQIVPGHRLFAHATHGLEQQPEDIWGRRSLFRVGGKPLLVSEIFLPAIHAIAAPSGRCGR
ncbi:hypothetical protein BOW53_00285 [Solemya pervernicosa gill symbiont]|uniref:Probable chorismate pyruvate-lyase n=1 Tax=Solemya pervernicosa gill symbiont TaxID=642797 RepID=A0A1T2LBA0_9GAMM|nr:hypothetical protein BOW53_00285 [Solemya pervernicosa gill symbiont]